MAVIGTPIGSASTITGVLATLLSELGNELRAASGTDAEKLWTESELIGYLNDAEKEIARRAYAITDASSYSITLLTGVREYSISSNILVIDRNEFSNTGFPLVVSTVNYLDVNEPTWKTVTGKPEKLIILEGQNKVAVTPVPISDYNNTTVSFVVKRIPKTPLSASNTTPEISANYYEDMKTWAKYKAFLKFDVETEDINRASMYYSIFENRVGSVPNANIERITKTNTPQSLQIQLRRYY